LKSASKSILKTFTEKKLRGQRKPIAPSKISNHQSSIINQTVECIVFSAKIFHCLLIDDC